MESACFVVSGSGWIETKPLHWLTEGVLEESPYCYIHMYNEVTMLTAEDISEILNRMDIERYPIVRKIKLKSLDVWRKVPRNARSTC